MKEACLSIGTNRIWISRQPKCLVNLYGTLSTNTGVDAYQATCDIPKHCDIRQAIMRLQQAGWNYEMWYALEADVETRVADVILKYRYADRRYRYNDLSKAMQTLQNLKREAWAGYKWQIVHYYF
jgi:hypothetical protein